MAVSFYFVFGVWYVVSGIWRILFRPKHQTRYTKHVSCLEPEIPERRLSDGLEQADLEGHAQPVPDPGSTSCSINWRTGFLPWPAKRRTALSPPGHMAAWIRSSSFFSSAIQCARLLAFLSFIYFLLRSVFCHAIPLPKKALVLKPITKPRKYFVFRAFVMKTSFRL
jgi:hypothetical protein